MQKLEPHVIRNLEIAQRHIDEHNKNKEFLENPVQCLLEFPTPIGVTEFTANQETITEAAEAVKKIIEDGDNTNVSDYGVSTNDDLNARKEFEDIKNLILDYSNSFIEDVVGIDKDDVTLSCMWSNAHNNGGKHHVHQHPNSFLSGVIYLQCPPCEDIGNLIFVDPRTAKNMIHPDFKQASPLSSRSIWVTPKKGLMVLFPSWLEHGTDEYKNTKNDEQRISMSFNFVLNKASSNTMRF